MTSDRPFDFFLHSLARAVARGETIAAWVGHFAGASEAASECSNQTEFVELVRKYRLEVAQKIAGEIRRTAAKLIDGQGADRPQKGNPRLSHQAAKVLIEKCVVLSMQLEEAEKLRSLAERVRALEERPAWNSEDIWRNSQN
jgi:hypothetical protein